MGLPSRRKGVTYEREALKLLQSAELECRRSAASGAQEGYVGDIELDLYGGLEIEVKYSAADTGMKIIRRYLEPVHLVMSRAPGEGWIMSFKQDVALKLMQDANELEMIRLNNPELFGPPDEHPSSIADGPHEGGWLER